MINRNDIDQALAVASQDGQTYYSLSYYPEKKKFDGSYRRIDVKLANGRGDLKVRTKRGYKAIADTVKP